MKPKNTLIPLVLCCLVALSALPRASHAEDVICDTARTTAGALYSTLLFGPAGTSTVMGCVFEANIDAGIVEREATMLLEEQQVYQPSHLGAYAQKIGAKSVHEAAQDVLQNGVRL